VTALVPSLTACLASSPGKISRTAVCTSRAEAHQDVHCVLQSCVYTLPHCCCTWISREEMVGFLLRRASLADSVAMRSNWSCNTPASAVVSGTTSVLPPGAPVTSTKRMDTSAPLNQALSLQDDE